VIPKGSHMATVTTRAAFDYVARSETKTL